MASVVRCPMSSALATSGTAPNKTPRGVSAASVIKHLRLQDTTANKNKPAGLPWAMSSHKPSYSNAVNVGFPALASAQPLRAEDMGQRTTLAMPKDITTLYMKMEPSTAAKPIPLSQIFNPGYTKSDPLELREDEPRNTSGAKRALPEDSSLAESEADDEPITRSRIPGTRPACFPEDSFSDSQESDEAESEDDRPSAKFHQTRKPRNKAQDFFSSQVEVDKTYQPFFSPPNSDPDTNQAAVGTAGRGKQQPKGAKRSLPFRTSQKDDVASLAPLRDGRAILKLNSGVIIFNANRPDAATDDLEERVRYWVGAMKKRIEVIDAIQGNHRQHTANSKGLITLINRALLEKVTPGITRVESLFTRRKARGLILVRTSGDHRGPDHPTWMTEKDKLSTTVPLNRAVVSS